ncbi:hypothetical protein [Gordonia hirsuta]|nr:hypothetical protein [Gordonia hirsuta]
MHPIWITVATLVTVAAVLLTVFWPNGSQGSAQIARTLEVEKLSFDDPSSIDAVTFMTSDKTSTSPMTTQATPVDITLRNNGDTPIKIVRIETTVLEAKTVSCNRQGGGMVVSAFYSVKIPYNPWTMELSSDTVSSDVDFTVKPKSGDRMVVTIGPEESGNGKAIVVAVSLKLIPESGDPVVLEPLALTQPEAVDQEIRSLGRTGGNDPSCKREQTGILDGFVKSTQMQSPDLLRLRNAFDG